MLTVFEGLEEKLSQAVETEEWKTLQKQFNEAEVIYMIGNGGNMAVASHGAADATRLTNKKVHCHFDLYHYHQIFENLDILKR